MIEDRLSDGVWVVRTHRNSWGQSRLAKLCDLPEHPYDFAHILCSHEDLCSWINKYRHAFDKKHPGWFPSDSEFANAILLFLAEKAGCIKKRRKRKKVPSRRIDFTL